MPGGSGGGPCLRSSVYFSIVASSGSKKTLPLTPSTTIVSPSFAAATAPVARMTVARCWFE